MLHVIIIILYHVIGRPDSRTAHAAEPAVDEKWIAQVHLVVAVVVVVVVLVVVVVVVVVVG